MPAGQKETPMLRYAILGMISLAASGAWAQQATPPVDTPPTASAQPPKAVVPMEEPRPGDHWTYEVRDEITGKISETRTNIVTDVTPKEINLRVDTLGKTDKGLIVTDRFWNLTLSGTWKYSPNDGMGIQLPLTVGKTWVLQTNAVNSANGSIWKRSGKSKVVGQETITTKAGTFETFKIEITYSGRNVNNPTLKNDVTMVSWYAPTIDHWVKRTFVSRTDNHLMTNNTLEVVDYGRKE
jgi:hypothetical protein